MIQRQQTLWLLLSAVASFFSFQYPFYTGTLIEKNMSAELDAGSNFFLLILTGGSVLIGAITIFLFKDRKAQFKLAIAGVVISIALLVIYFMQMKKFASGTLSLTSILALLILIGYIMAARGVWKDEKLVKSLDKLR
jgi:predicted MFS family arabinose efflux permease